MLEVNLPRLLSTNLRRILNISTKMPTGSTSMEQCRGRLIVFEGCDRSGKSTQCSLLAEKLKADGHKVELFKFPDRTSSIGILINNYLSQKSELSDEVIHLLFSANRWENMQKMVDLLYGGTTLIVDRYAYSGIAYSAAKGMDLAWCRQPDVGLVKPDKVIYMTLSSQVASQRAQFGEERYEKVEIQTKVSNIFKQLHDADYWQDVSGDGSIEEVHTKVFAAVSDLFTTDCGALQKLWAPGTIEPSS